MEMPTMLNPMMAQKRGNIVSLSSVAGLRGSEQQAHYCAAKAGIIGFTRTLAFLVPAIPKIPLEP